MARKVKTGQSKFQKFETEAISRSQIKGADYNPRIISQEAKKQLRKMIAKHGLVQPLVWNKRTGTLVAGHQRLAALDSLERSEDYILQVAVIDVDEREEKILNVQLNNPSMQGDWDLDKLISISDEAAIMPDEFGFSDGDIAVIFGDDRLDEILGDTREVAEAKGTLKEIKENRSEAIQSLQNENGADFYFTVVFETEAQKQAVLKQLGIPVYEALVNGRTLAAMLGV